MLLQRCWLLPQLMVLVDTITGPIMLLIMVTMDIISKQHITLLPIHKQ